MKVTNDYGTHMLHKGVFENAKKNTEETRKNDFLKKPIEEIKKEAQYSVKKGSILDKEA